MDTFRLGTSSLVVMATLQTVGPLEDTLRELFQNLSLQEQSVRTQMLVCYMKENLIYCHKDDCATETCSHSDTIPECATECNGYTSNNGAAKFSVDTDYLILLDEEASKQCNDLSYSGSEDCTCKAEQFMSDYQDLHHPSCNSVDCERSTECAYERNIMTKICASVSEDYQCNSAPVLLFFNESECKPQPSSCNYKLQNESDILSSLSPDEDSYFADEECSSTASETRAKKCNRYRKKRKRSSSSGVCTSDSDTPTYSNQSESHTAPEPHKLKSQLDHVASSTQSNCNHVMIGCGDESLAYTVVNPSDFSCGPSSTSALCSQLMKTQQTKVSENKLLGEIVTIKTQNFPSSNFCFTQMLAKVDFSHNVCEYSGNNCLHIAMDTNHIWAMKFLLKKFDLSDLIIRQNFNGFSPLSQAMVSDKHEAAAALLQELIYSQGIISVARAFPPSWLRKVSSPELLHIYFHKSLKQCIVLAICEECEFCDSLSAEPFLLKVEDSDASRVFGKSLRKPSSRSKDSKSIATTSNVKEQVNKKAVAISCGARYEAHPLMAEAVDTSNSSLHFGQVAKPLEMMKKAVQGRDGCCQKHKIMECFVLGKEIATPNLRMLAEEHSDLINHKISQQDENKTSCRLASTQRPLRQITHSHQNEVHLIGSTRHAAAIDRQNDHFHKIIRTSSQLLHVPDYEQMYEVLAGGFQNCPSNLSPKLLIAFHFGCGLSQYKRGQLEEATRSFSNCESIALSACCHGDVALVNLYKGDIQFSQFSYDEAITSYTKAVEFCDVAHIESVAQEFRMVVPSLSIFNSKLGAAYRSASKPVNAIKCYVRAIESAEVLLSNSSTETFTAAQKDKLAAHTSLGNLYQSMGENSKALDEYKVSIELSMQLEDNISLGWAHGNMGNALLGLYRKDEALYHLKKALDIAVEHEPTPQAIGRTYNNLGTAYQSMNDLDKAEEYYDLALSQAIYGNDTAGQARVYGNIGNLLMLRKDYERAIPHYTEVLRLTKDSSTLSTALHNRGCAYYEWAECLRNDSKPENVFYLYGKEFENCETDHKPPDICPTVKNYYREGSKDLTKALQYHEENLESIKGSQKGLNLSVSLFESNSRTFHRLQDCLVGLGEWQRALSIAEQCRARTLGELMLKNRECSQLTTPLSLQSIIDIAKESDSIVVYLSYTGARVLIWVFIPARGPQNSSMTMIEVPVHDEQFDGKSFDYYLKSLLTEELVEHTYDMYSPADYASKHNDPVKKLYNLLGKPLLKVINQLLNNKSVVEKIVVIPDSYTSLLPLSCLLDSEMNTFLGDNFRFEIMPSLLTVGLVDQLPPGVVKIPADSHNMCIAGNPAIPQFEYNGEVWNLGRIPYAEKEANWVSYKLNASPIVRENATKNTIKMRIQSAKIIHLATHGSATSGFLAFAGMMSSRRSDQADSKDVLLYPEEIEKLTIKAALVVLSSCDSGRGIVKADGIQGMARAFILAGAQAVLTTLWRVPDESASIFMQLFYQYLLDGYQTSEALHKAVLSLRCFSKYSDYIHWSGYQLTGRDTRIVSNKTPASKFLEQQLGRPSAFTRLVEVKKLESAFIKDSRLPSDVQIIRGPPGLRPSEPVKDFVHCHHERFTGGVFVINCRHPDIIDATIQYIEKITGTDIEQLPISEHQQALFVFDSITELPTSEKLLKVMKNKHVHIVFNSKSHEPPDALIKEVDKKLIRGCAVHHLEPLSMIESTQRIVHSVMKDHHLAPNNEDQKIFQELAEFTSGSPVIVEVTTKSLLAHFRENKKDTHEVLGQFAKAVSLQLDGRKSRRKSPLIPRKTRSFSKRFQEEVTCAVSLNPAIPPTQEQLDAVWDTNSQYDSWDSIEELISSCHLTPEERFLLNTLCMFSCSPIPYSLVIEISSLIAMATQQPHIAGTLSYKLLEMRLMKKYPSPIILHSSLADKEHETEPEFVYVPQYISRSIWKNLEESNRVMVLSTMFQALLALHKLVNPLEAQFFLGLCGLLLGMIEFDLQVMGEECYQSVQSLYGKYKERLSENTPCQSTADSDKPQPDQEQNHFGHKQYTM